MPRSPATEHPLLEGGVRDLVAATVLAALTAALFLLVALPSTYAAVQRVDHSFLRTVEANRAGWLTAVARFFNFLGLAPVTLPIRIVAAGYLAFRRRWWHFSAFVAAVVLSEALIAPLKSVYDRPRPPHPLVATTGGSFPSGHAIAAAVTAVALVIAFLPTGRQRVVWGTAAAVFSLAMGLSRAYLAAHWLSDAVAGTLLGVTCAVVTALATQAIRDARRRRRRRTDAGARGVTAPT